MVINIEPVAKLANASCFMDGSAEKIFAALGGECLFVGGTVRDAALQRQVGDFDIATPIPPNKVMSLLRDKGIKAIPTGLDHGTITAICDDVSYEITTLRRDVSTDGRRAVVAYTEDWREDAGRRDFTFNTLLADLAGNIYDPLGCGYSDLQAGLVNFVGTPDHRIAEDYLRILRYFRFLAFYGHVDDVDEKLLSAIYRGQGGLLSISKERITAEMLKLLQAPEPEPVLALISNLDQFSWLKGNAIYWDRLREVQTRCSVKAAPITLLFAISLLNLDVLKSNFRLSAKQLKLCSSMLSFIKDSKSLSDQHLLYSYGYDEVVQSVLLRYALNQIDIEYAVEFAKGAKNWVQPEFPMKGGDLIGLGLKQGPLLGKIISKTKKVWIDSSFSMSRQQCLEYAKRYIKT